MQLDGKFVRSDEVVARTIDGQLVLVPLTSSVGEGGEEIFALNRTGAAIWQLLDETRTLGEVAAQLAGAFEGPIEEIETDVRGLVDELVKRHMAVPCAVMPE